MTDELQPGTIFRINRDNGFGYVRDAAHEHSFIFLIGLGRAITWAQARTLTVGNQVRFRLDKEGRVAELLPDGAAAAPR